MTNPYPLNSKDKRDLEVYIKQFCYKCIQTIVSSRNGSALLSESSLKTPSWFNVSLADDPVILEQCKQNFLLNDLFMGKTVSLTIQLYTPEAEVMTLEIWTFSFDKKYENVKVTFTVYNALCLLLRSVIAASRATPTYRLTRKQTNGGFFTITYMIQTEEPRISELGDSVKSERIGIVGTPSGTVTANVFYRTTLEIPASSPSQPRTPEQITVETDAAEVPVIQEPDSDSLPFCPFADTTLPNFTDITPANLSDEKETPFASLLESAFPFSQSIAVSQNSQTSDASTKEDAKSVLVRSGFSPAAVTPTPEGPITGSPRIQELQKDVMTSDSFVLIAPFASNSPEDIGSFFRDCANIPKLKLFSESASQSSVINPASVERDVKEIEDFLNEMSFDESS